MVFKQFEHLWLLAGMLAIDTQGGVQLTLLLILIHNGCESAFPYQKHEFVFASLIGLYEAIGSDPGTNFFSRARIVVLMGYVLWKGFSDKEYFSWGHHIIISQGSVLCQLLLFTKLPLGIFQLIMKVQVVVLNVVFFSFVVSKLFM